MLLFLDSFDHYDRAEDKYLAGASIVTVTGGRHGKGLPANADVRCAPRPTHNRFIFGIAFKFASTFSQFVDISDSPGQSIGNVQVTNGGAIKVILFGGPTAQTIDDIVRVNQWHYIEIDLTIIATVTGASSCKYSFEPAIIILDGNIVLNTTLQYTINQNGLPSTAKWGYYDIGSNINSGVFDDHYLCDGAGGPPWNAPVGDIRIDVIRPNGVGAITEWTPVGVSANWDTNNDVSPDDETTHVVATVANRSDLYEMEDVSTSGTVIGAQALVNARRTEEGFASLATLVRHAGATTELPAESLSPTYFYRNRHCFDKMPNGDGLTDANINAMQVGFRRTL